MQRVPCPAEHGLPLVCHAQWGRGPRWACDDALHHSRNRAIASIHSVCHQSRGLPLCEKTGYNKRMVPSKKHLPLNMEVIDDEMARIIPAKTGAERLQNGQWHVRQCSKNILSHLHAEHPDWDPQRISHEAARRLSHGAT